jgi:hypothetical protein
MLFLLNIKYSVLLLVSTYIFRFFNIIIQILYLRSGNMLVTFKDILSEAVVSVSISGSIPSSFF